MSALWKLKLSLYDMRKLYLKVFPFVLHKVDAQKFVKQMKEQTNINLRKRKYKLL